MTIPLEQEELSTQQAADFLHVSCPYLLKLLDEGQIPSHKVGTQQRVRLEDIKTYEQDILTKRHAALNELTALSQKLGLYDM